MATDGNFTAESAAQHQAELNDYLQSKNINQLFIQIVESLLIEKPDNPIGSKDPRLCDAHRARATRETTRAETETDVLLSISRVHRRVPGEEVPGPRGGRGADVERGGRARRGG